MTFDEYTSAERSRYDRLAGIVESILVAALESNPQIRIQQTQRRAKSPSSLKRKLERSGHLDAHDIENHAKDLSGCRLIFYTNSDASRFLSSGIVRDNFDVDWDRSKIHHPTSDAVSAADQFISNNYVVRLKDDRASLPEYSTVAGLWCEVQVQTTLNHAWAEMAHDTIYKKPDLPGGFGSKLMQSIEGRMKSIMRKHLLPAGYEFQKVLNDFERLSTGKDLFDKGLVSSIDDCNDNNDRFELLEQFSSYVLPHYDDSGAAYADVTSGMRKVVEEARNSQAVPIDTLFGSYPGHSPQEVISKAADIIDRVRYVDIDSSFDFLLDVFTTAGDDDERGRWKKSGEELSQHELQVWEKAGPIVQLRLLGRIKRLPAQQKQTARGLLITMLRKILEVEITGTTAHFDTITFSRGAIPISAAVIRMRRDAIRLLKLFFLTASTDEQRREALSALHDGTRQTGREGADDAGKVTLLQHSKDIITFYAQNVDSMSNELLAKMEHKALWLFRHTPQPPSEVELVGVGLAQLELRQAILSFRDQINTNERFVIFKTLVGYDSVFQPSWEDNDFEISQIDDYRSARIDEFVAAMSDSNLSYWSDIVRECAAIQSSDLATFPKLSEFLEKIARQKPKMALAIFEQEEALLSNFLPSLLHGWEESSGGPDAGELKRKWVSEGKFLAAVVWSFRLGGALDVGVLEAALEQAIKVKDRLALYNIVTIADLRNEDANDHLVEPLLIPAIRALTNLEEHGWPRAVWGRRSSTFKNLDETQAKAILDALVSIPRLDWDDEQILATIADAHPKLVVDSFSDRLSREREPGTSYDAVPFQFSKLNEILVHTSEYVIDCARSWYSNDSRLFMYRGGRFVVNVFHNDWPLLENELRRFLTDDEEDVAFVVQILRGYEGEEFLHPLLKDIVERIDPASETLEEVGIVLEESGVIAGEFGFVELHQQRRDLMTKWLTDTRQRVREFADRHIRSLENRIAAEQQRAETDHELRKREWSAEDSLEESD